MTATDEGALRQVAALLGPSCVAAKALALVDARRAEGEDVRIFRSGRKLLVGPPIESD